MKQHFWTRQTYNLIDQKKGTISVIPIAARFLKVSSITSLCSFFWEGSSKAHSSTVKVTATSWKLTEPYNSQDISRRKDEIHNTENLECSLNVQIISQSPRSFFTFITVLANIKIPTLSLKQHNNNTYQLSCWNLQFLLMYKSSPFSPQNTTTSADKC